MKSGLGVVTTSTHKLSHFSHGGIAGKELNENVTTFVNAFKVTKQQVAINIETDCNMFKLPKVEKATDNIQWKRSLK